MNSDGNVLIYNAPGGHVVYNSHTSTLHGISDAGASLWVSSCTIDTAWGVLFVKSTFNVWMGTLCAHPEVQT